MKPEDILKGLLPDVAAKCRQHLKLCADKGIVLLLTSGWRSPEEQVRLFTKGRLQDPNIGWHVVDPKRVVTNALPEQSAHCRGAAYDIVPVINERAAWDRWDLFEIVGTVGENLGLLWGGRWPKLKDMPHFELPNWRGLPLKEE